MSLPGCPVAGDLKPAGGCLAAVAWPRVRSICATHRTQLCCEQLGVPTSLKSAVLPSDVLSGPSGAGRGPCPVVLVCVPLQVLRLLRMTRFCPSHLPSVLPLPVTCPWCTWCGSMTSGTHKRGHFSYLISSISVYPVACGQESSCRCRRLQVQVRSRGREDPLETGMATHSSVLAWRISWTEEPGGLQFIGLQKSWTRPSKVLLFINGESKLFMLRFNLHL